MERPGLGKVKEFAQDYRYQGMCIWNIKVLVLLFSDEIKNLQSLWSSEETIQKERDRTYKKH